MTPRVVTKTQIEEVLPPEALLHCKTRPIPPDPGASIATWATYIIDLRAWGQDCEEKVDAMKAYVEQHQHAQ